MMEPSLSEVEVPVGPVDVDRVEEAESVHSVVVETNNDLPDVGESVPPDTPLEPQVVEEAVYKKRALPASVRSRSRLESIMSKVRQARAGGSAISSPASDCRPGVRPTPLAWLDDSGEYGSLLRYGSLLGFSRSKTKSLQQQNEDSEKDVAGTSC